MQIKLAMAVLVLVGLLAAALAARGQSLLVRPRVKSVRRRNAHESVA